MRRRPGSWNRGIRRAGVSCSGAPGPRRCRRSGRRTAWSFHAAYNLRLPGERAPAGQLQVALSPFERLKGRLFVDSKHDRVVRRGQVKPDNLGRLGGKFRIVADAPGFAPGEIDLLGAQKPPDVLDMNVAEPPR